MAKWPSWRRRWQNSKNKPTFLARVEEQEAKIEKVNAKLETRAAGKKIALSEP